MEIKKNITINFSEEDVKKIIADYLNREGYVVEVSNVRLEVGSTCVGYGRDEHMVTRFKGAYVDCKEKIKCTHQEQPNENYFEEMNDYLDGTMNV